MTLDEIFGKLVVHMIEGLMFHDQMANYYNFLGLEGYAECHTYHYLEESCNFNKLESYYVTHCNRLIPELRATDPAVIPDSWYKYNRMDVDTNTKRNAVKTGLEKWMKWETETKQLYESMHKELVNSGYCAAALEVAKLIEDVTCELHEVTQYYLNKKSTDYDIINIIEEQDQKKECYEIRCRGIFLHQ